MLTKIHKKHIIFVKTTSLIVIILLSFVALCLVSYFTFKDNYYKNRFYPNIYIDGQKLSGADFVEGKKKLLRVHKPLDKLLITVVFENQPIATFSAKSLQLKRNIDSKLQQAYQIGREAKTSTRMYQKIGTIFNLIQYKSGTTLSYSKKPIEDFIKITKEDYNRPAENALFEFDGTRVKSFKQEKDGFKIDDSKLQQDIEQAVKLLSNSKLKLEGKPVKPQITLAEVNNFGIEELVGVGVSDYSGSIVERIHNLTLATLKFNGILVPKDGIVSFNDIVGDISSSTGYKPAYIIKGGRTVLGDGGGVCQVSTTLFRAALNAGLPIIERTEHAYRVGYYENDSRPGFDATVYSPSVDLKIRNDTEKYILIQTEVDYSTSQLYFRFYGKRDDRQVYLSQPSLTDEQPPPPAKYEDDPTLKKGVTKQVDFAAWGGKSNFIYRVTKNGQVVFEKKFFSSYRPWQAVYMVGQAD